MHVPDLKKLGVNVKTLLSTLVTQYLNKRKESMKKRLMRGHDIIAVGWAETSNPHPTPTNIHKKYLKHLFFHFST